MKLQVGTERPGHFQPGYPEQWDIVSHLECAAGIPQTLFAITTRKENGQPNVCFHSWSCFHGDKTAFFAVLGGLFQHTHTYANILREGVFCLNFLPLSAYEGLCKTILYNQEDLDEIQAGGFTLEPAATLDVPCIRESFLQLECTLEEAKDLSGAGITAMVTGRVRQVRVEEAYAKELDRRYGPAGFMLLASAPQNLQTGQASPSRILTLNIARYD
ncbi:MAG TPA: flavin reductase [Candidatus Pelethousia gallinarum]|nr:flavin reductase [Candidatus Pelethousia gallinarum]